MEPYTKTEIKDLLDYVITELIEQSISRKVTIQGISKILKTFDLDKGSYRIKVKEAIEAKGYVVTSNEGFAGSGRLNIK